MERDFTYIYDIIEGMVRVMNKPPAGNPEWDGQKPDTSSSPAPYRLYNIGNNNPVKLMDFIRELENTLKKKARINYMPIQPGDVPKTWADVKDLASGFQYKPDAKLSDGIMKFIKWYNGTFRNKLM